METNETLQETEPEETTDDVSESSSEDMSPEEPTEETPADETVAYTESADNSEVVFTEERAQQLEGFISIVVMAIIFVVAVTVFKALYRFLKIFF